MRNIRALAMLTTVLAFASTAGAQTGSGGNDTNPAPTGTGAGATVTSSAGGSVTTSSPDVDKQVETIRRRGAAVSKSARDKAEAKLRQIVGKVDATAQQGEERVATRLATQFHTTAQAMMDEKTQFGCGWGELMIAHTLAASSNADISLQTLFQMHADGMGWGQIAAGMGFNLGDAVHAARAEARVAEGDAKADGKVAVMHGVGSKYGLGASAGMGADANAHGAGARAGGGTSVSTSVPSVHVGH